MDVMQVRRLLCTVVAVVGALVTSSAWFAHAETPLTSKTLALVGGRILTQADAGTVEGTVVIRDGKIAAVGPKVAIPGDAARIDVSGCVVTPGLIDARGTLWLAGTASRDSASDAGLDVLDAIDPHGEDWKEVVRQGVTAVYVQPSGLLGGKGAVLRVGPAQTVEELLIKPAAALQATLGAAPAALAAAPALPTTFPRRGGPPPVAQPTPPTAPPTTNALARFGQYEQLKRSLDAAKLYDDSWKKAEKAKGKASVKRDATKDFLRKVLAGEVPMRIEAQREDDVRNALRLADEFKIRVVLDGVNNPRGAATSVVNRRVPLVLGPFADGDDAAASRRERAADWPTAVLSPEGKWALGTFSSQPRGSRLLRVHAAAAVARGVDSDRVLRAMTRDAAEILGIGDRLGTIAAGKQADLAVFAGDPLDPSVPARLVVSNGKIAYQADAAPVASTPRTKLNKEIAALPAKLPKQYALKTNCLCLEDGKPQPGMLLVENGKVAAIGSTMPVSAGIPVFDLGAAMLTPGLVVGHTQLGLAAAIDDPAEADSTQVSAADVYDPQQRQVRDFLGAGFTSAVFTPGAVNVIAGSACGVRLGAPGPFGGDAALKFVLTSSSRGASRTVAENPEDPIVAAFGRARGPARYPGSLAGQAELVEQVLSGKGPASDLFLPPLVRQEVEKERRQRVAAVVERKQVALFEAHTRAEIDAALQLIARFKLRGVLVYPDEIRPFLPELKRLGVGIVADPIHANDYDRAALQLAEAATAGIPIAFGATSAHEARLTAALAVNAGMPRDAAWRGLTTTAGELAGLPNTVGRLVPDGPADWVIWDGPPLDLRSKPLRVAVAGQFVNVSR